MSPALATFEESWELRPRDLPWRAGAVSLMEAAGLALIVQDGLLFVAIAVPLVAGSIWMWRYQRTRRERCREQAGRTVVETPADVPRWGWLRLYGLLALLILLLTIDLLPSLASVMAGRFEVPSSSELLFMGILLLFVARRWEFSFRARNFQLVFAENGWLFRSTVPQCLTFLNCVFGVLFAIAERFVPREQIVDHHWRTREGSELLYLKSQDPQGKQPPQLGPGIAIVGLTPKEKEEIDRWFTTARTEQSP